MECRRRLGPVAPLLLVFLSGNYLKFSPQLISGCVNRKKLLLSSLCKKETDRRRSLPTGICFSFVGKGRI